jgi:hypothetical protein
MSSNLPIVSQRVKVEWLREHPTLIAGWPLGVRPCVQYPIFKTRTRPPDEDPLGVRSRWRVIVAALKHEGMVSSRTYTGDVRVPAIVAAVVHRHPADACTGCKEWRHCEVLHNLRPGRRHRRRRTHRHRPV